MVRTLACTLLASAAGLGGCGALSPYGLPDVGALSREAMGRAPGGAMEEFNPAGSPPVEYATPVAVVRITRPEWPHEISGPEDCRYDIIVEGFVRGRSVDELDAWHLAHDAGKFRLGPEYASHYTSTLRTYPAPPRDPSVMCILYGAPCADLPVPEEFGAPRGKEGEPIWTRRRWAYPVVTDRPITEAKVYVHAEAATVWSLGRRGPTLAVTPREVPVLEQAALDPAVVK